MLWFDWSLCFLQWRQARFLLAKLNLSASYNNASEMNTGSDVIFIDESSLEVFYQHLQKLAVQSRERPLQRSFSPFILDLISINLYEEIQINESIIKINKNANHYPKNEFYGSIIVSYILHTKK